MNIKTRKKVIEEALVADPDRLLWENTAVRHMLNRALELWSRRVSVPMYYEFVDADRTDNVLKMPVYVNPPYRLFIKQGDEWEITSHFYVFDKSPQQEIQLGEEIQSYEKFLLEWNYHNPPVPVEDFTLNGAITDSSTSLVLSPIADLPKKGILKIDNEFILYLDYDPSTGTVSQLTRGFNDSDTASHSDSVEVDFCFVVINSALWVQLNYQLTAYLYEWIFAKGPSQDAERNQWLLRYNQQKADEFWLANQNHQGSLDIRLSSKATAK